jgi:rhamnogalacturonan endolyase
VGKAVLPIRHIHMGYMEKILHWFMLLGAGFFLFKTHGRDVMIRKLLLSSIGFFLMSMVGWSSGEQLDYGLVALPREDGSIFLSWRMLDANPSRYGTSYSLITEYELERKEGENGEWSNLSLRNQGRVNNHVDQDVTSGTKYTYRLSRTTVSREAQREAFEQYWKQYHANQPMPDFDQVAEPVPDPVEITVTASDTGRSYFSIPLDGDYDYQKIGIGDLDGDGELEYVIRQPDFNTDPYQQPGYWKPSTTTYKLEAYEMDGTLKWRYDMGWAIEAGVWYAPWIIYDVDQDGRAEVYCKAGEGDPRTEKGHVESGPEYLVKIDGETGEVVAKTDWIGREGFDSYNYYSRNFLNVAYLDGKTPSIYMQRGTYRLIRARTLDRDFNIIWEWEATGEYEKYRGQSSHGSITTDVDQDGKDEIVIGAAVLDDDGKGLWTLAMGHPDVCYVADIVPDNPGVEIFYGFETRQETDGICVVDARTGKKLWAHKDPTRHIHGQGMVGDLLADHPGMEVFAGERDLPQRWLYSAGGKLIQFMEKGSLSPRPVWWDADPQKEVVEGRTIRDWGGETIQEVEGKVVLIVDCLGDHREEVITALDGEIRIYTTTIPDDTPQPCLLLNRQYRSSIAAQTMGYYYPAQLGPWQ